MKVDRIALIGYRATGKTTVGRSLADRLGWQFLDTDAQIAQDAGRSIAAIFKSDGEEAFRKLEVRAIAANAERKKCVLSLGGGAVMREPNRRAIRSSFTVLLTASAESIHQRLSLDAATAEQRPNLTRQGGLAEVQQMLAKRESTYRACADLIVDTDDVTIENIVEEIERKTRLRERDKKV